MSNNALRLYGEYQMYGDLEPEVWFDNVAVSAVEQDLIVGHEYLAGLPGIHGIVLVTFTVDVPLIEGSRFDPDMDIWTARKRGTELLNEIVGDTDAECRWISPITLP